MRRLWNFVIKVIKTVVICGAGWDYLKKVWIGIGNGEISLDVTIAELVSFLFVDWFWIVLIVYGMIYLIPFGYKKIQQVIVGWKRKKSEQRKQEIREVLQEKYTG